MTMWLMYTTRASNCLPFHLLLFYAVEPQFCWSFAKPRGRGSQCFAGLWIKELIVKGKLENVPFPVCNGKWVTLTAEVLSKSPLFWANWTQTSKRNNRVVFFKSYTPNDTYEIVAVIIYSFFRSISSSAITNKDAWVRSVRLSYWLKTTQ